MSAPRSVNRLRSFATLILVPVGLVFIVMVTPSGIDGQSLLGKLLEQESYEFHSKPSTTVKPSSVEQIAMRSMTGETGSSSPAATSTPASDVRVADDWMRKVGIPTIGE